jgi:hypothetical protein
MTRRAVIPAGSWPRRMCAQLAAGYCGEPSVEAFLNLVGVEYPRVEQDCGSSARA